MIVKISPVSDLKIFIGLMFEKIEYAHKSYSTRK